MVYRKKTNKKRIFRKKHSKKNNKKYKGGAKLIWRDQDGRQQEYEYHDNTLEGYLEPGMPFELVLFLMQKNSGLGRDAMYRAAQDYVSAYPERSRAEARARPAEARARPAEARARPAEARAEAREGPVVSIMPGAEGKSCERRVSSRRGTDPMTSELGHPTSMNQQSCGSYASPAQITKFIAELPKKDDHVLSMSVGPWRHAIYVRITPERIFIADWHGGDTLAPRGISCDYRAAYNATDVDEKGKPRKVYEDWNQQYKDVILELRKQFGRKIQFFPEDSNLLARANAEVRAGGGGCVFYATNWWKEHKGEPNPELEEEEDPRLFTKNPKYTSPNEKKE